MHYTTLKSNHIFILHYNMIIVTKGVLNSIMKKQFLLISVIIIALTSCDLSSSDPSSSDYENSNLNGDFICAEELIDEDFEESNKPFFEQNISDDSYLLTPWNYEKESNLNRDYPLVIYLHGKGSAGNPVSFFGKDNDDYKKRYPSFVYIPHEPSTSYQWNTSSLITKIENLKNTYRVDCSRIYLAGYSMGAYSAVPLANSYDTYNGTYFAGILSMTGLRDLAINDAVKDKTSIWIHMGDQERGYVVDGTRERYDELKAYYSGEIETSNNVSISSYSNLYEGTTLTVTLNGTEILKKTEYYDVGHGVSSFPYLNPKVLRWLFSRDLDKR